MPGDIQHRVGIRKVSGEDKIEHQNRKAMKLSIEARVAAAVATAFVALTVGAIGQERSGGQIGKLNGYGPTNNPAVNTYLSQRGYSSSLVGNTNAEADEGD